MKRNVQEYYNATAGKYAPGLTMGVALKNMIEIWGLSQSWFAKWTKIHPSVLNLICNEQRIPTKRQFIIIDAFLNGYFDSQIREEIIKKYSNPRKRLYDELIDAMSEKGGQGNGGE